MTQHEQTFGTWASPISPRALAGASLRLGEVVTDGGQTFWWEGRPDEGGRGVVVTTAPDGSHVDVTPSDMNVRTLVHEYGGGAWTVASGVVYFCDYATQQIHRTGSGGMGLGGMSDAAAITDEPGSRFADLTIHPDGHHLLAVRERHTATSTEPQNDLVSVDLASGAVTSLFSGTDFVSSPRPSPDGSRVAFITWSHPNMPWDHTELRLLRWSPGDDRSDARLLIEAEAVQQPVWRGDELIAVTDRTGWWLPHVVDQTTGQATALLDAEIDAGMPPWVFGSTTLVEHDEELAVLWQSDGVGHIGWLHDGRLTEIDVPEIDFSSITVTGDGRIASAAATAASARSIVIIDRDGGAERLHDRDQLVADDDVSAPEHISFDSHGRTAHALLYRPASSTVVGPDDERPPLLVLGHGGPTGAARPGFDLSIQFWTTRGFAVVDVNYGGSTGYGREYRNLLQTNWGIVDVEDCIAAALHLADTGVVDGSRMAIKGGSAGGYTTLAALAFHDVFAVGASRYGIGDLETLARDTHKFESRYVDGLVGPYPEARDVYVERSPIHATDRISAPMIVLQGSEDKIVPPNQAEDLVRALAGRGLPHAYLLFEGEQHGFRNAENIARAAEAEYVFFCKVFGIEPSGDPEPLDIVGLD